MWLFFGIAVLCGLVDEAVQEHTAEEDLQHQRIVAGQLQMLHERHLEGERARMAVERRTLRAALGASKNRRWKRAIMGLIRDSKPTRSVCSYDHRAQPR